MAEKLSPWLRGIVDTLVGAELLLASAIAHKNRLAVILIDSAFETACRAFLQHKARITLSDNHKHRKNLISTVKSKLTHIDQGVWDSINFYYEEIRCDFYHQSAGKTIVDTAVLDYRDTVEFVIDKAFSTQIREAVQEEVSRSSQPDAVESAPDTPHSLEELLPKVTNRTDKVIIAVAALNQGDVREVNQFFKRAGDGVRLKSAELTNILARNSGSKRYFFYDRAQKSWSLSGLGRFKLKQLEEAESK